MGLLMSACVLNPLAWAADIEPTQTALPAPPSKIFNIKTLNLGVKTLKGKITMDPNLLSREDYSSVIMLQDASSIVLHDRTIPASSEAQTLGFITQDGEDSMFTLMLPIQPKGKYHDLDHDGVDDQGVQVFYISMETRHGGGAYFEKYEDWSLNNSSIYFKDDTIQNIEGGYLIVWAPDDKQSFPSDFGKDGILFTEDDPTKALEQGYTMIDMTYTTIVFGRVAEQFINLYQFDLAMNLDLEDMSYTEAFDSLFKDMKENYAFLGVTGKEPDWETIYNLVYPDVQSAEEEENDRLYIKALKLFADQFPDSHVSAMQAAYNQRVTDKNYNGYGFMVAEVEQGSFIISYMDEENGLETYGIRLGDVLLSVGGEPIEKFLQTISASYGPYSRTEVERADKIRQLTRGVAGIYQNFEFQLSDGSIVPVSIPAYWDYPNYFYGVENQADLLWPVEYDILQSGYGYVAITSHNGGESLTRHLFENAMDEFTKAKVPGIIVDLRANNGGELINFFEYFLQEPVKLSRWVYPGSRNSTGEMLEYDIWAQPFERQYAFEDIAVLVGPHCFSACEVEAYGFSLLPGVKMIGSQPTAGGVATIHNSTFSLPDEITFTFPVAKFVNEDGSLFLEGQGVAPQIVFPETLGTISTQGNWLLYYTDQYLQYEDVMQITPAYSPQPVYMDTLRLVEMIMGDSMIDLTHASIEFYPQTFVPGKTYQYHAFIEVDDDVFVSNNICAKDTASLGNYLTSTMVRYKVNGEEIPVDYGITELLPVEDQWCMQNLLSLSDWSVGMNEVVTEVTYSSPIYDGQRWIPAGMYTQVYTVVVKESE
jgi:C-terminal processing protease CtpA/Prc